MKAIIFAVLAVVSINATAGNYVAHKQADGTMFEHSTYEAASMKELDASTSCKRLNAKQLIKRAKLAPNTNIVGGYDCGSKRVDFQRFTVYVKDITLTAKAAK